MAKLILSTILFFSFLNAQNTQAADGSVITVSKEWQLISCKQTETSGITLQRRHFAGEPKVQLLVVGDSDVKYEIWIDGEFKASCAFVSVRNSTNAGNSN